LITTSVKVNTNFEPFKLNFADFHNLNFCLNSTDLNRTKITTDIDLGKQYYSEFAIKTG